MFEPHKTELLPGVITQFELFCALLWVSSKQFLFLIYDCLRATESILKKMSEQKTWINKSDTMIK